MVEKKTKQVKASLLNKGLVVVEQVRGATRRPGYQGETLRGLGLGRIGKRSTLKDSPQVRGMILSVAHLVKIHPQEDGV